MVSVVEPVLPELLLLSLPPPHAATPNASAVTRQPEAATERTRKVPPQRCDTEVRAILCRPQDGAQRSQRRTSFREMNGSLTGPAREDGLIRVPRRSRGGVEP